MQITLELLLESCDKKGKLDDIRGHTANIYGSKGRGKEMG